MNQKISNQKKKECIGYALEHPEKSLQQLAKDFGVGYSTLNKWVREARKAGQTGAKRELSPEQKRIAQLEKEVSHLREVNDILKKAHVYFVNNPNR
jgi:transposase-like protein